MEALLIYFQDLPELVEKISFRFQVSPYLVNGAYVGSRVCCVPDVEGVVLSPDEPRFGMTLVYEC